MMKKRTSAVKMKKNPTPAKKALKGKQGSLPKELKDAILAAPGKMLKPSAMKMMKQNSSMKMMKKKPSAVKMADPRLAKRKTARQKLEENINRRRDNKAMMKNKKMIKRK